MSRDVVTTYAKAIARAEELERLLTPMTNAQISRAYRNAPDDVGAAKLLSERAFHRLFRYVEACHRITEEPKA